MPKELSEAEKQFIQDQKKVEEMVQVVVDISNHTRGSQKLGFAMAQKLYQNHRTLQQSTIAIFAEMIAAYGNLCGQYGDDLRNEQAHKWAIKVAEITEQHHFPFI